MISKDPQNLPFLATAAIGGIIGFGQLLNSREPLTWRVIVGRAICSAGLGAAGPLLLLWFPDVPMFVIFAASSLLASLGTSTLQKAAQKYLKG